MSAVAVAVDPWGFRPFTTLRWALIGVAIAVAAYGSLRPSGGERGTARRGLRRVGIAWLVLLVTLALAAVLSDDWISGILGHPRRHLGVVGWGICALAFLVGSGLNTFGDQLRLARGTAVAGLVAALAAVVDRLGWDPLDIEFANNRAGGLLGQPVYLAALLVLVLPITVGLAADPAETRQWRWVGAVAAAASVAALWATQTRGAWLGSAVAVVVAAIAHRGLRDWLRRRRLAVAVAGIVALGAMVGPVSGLFDRSTDGGLGRVDDWRVATEVIADNPVLGVGPEGYRIAALRHIDEAYTDEHGRDELVDRAHNNVLDVAASGGLAAAGAYIVILGAVVTTCVRLLQRRAGPLEAGMAIGVLAWLAQQLVSFPLAEVDPAGWLFAGTVAASASSLNPIGRSATNRVQRMCIATVGGVLAVVGLTAVAADRDLNRAEDDMHRSRAAALDAADSATSLRPDDIDAWYVAAQVAASGEDLLSVDAGLDRVESGLDRFPHDPALLTLHEELLVERALRSELNEDLQTAQAAAQDMVGRDPSNPMHRRLLELVDDALKGGG